MLKDILYKNLEETVLIIKRGGGGVKGILI